MFLLFLLLVSNDPEQKRDDSIHGLIAFGGLLVDYCD